MLWIAARVEYSAGTTLYSRKMSSSAKPLRKFSWLVCISCNSFGKFWTFQSVFFCKLSLGDAPIEWCCAAIMWAILQRRQKGQIVSKFRHPLNKSTHRQTHTHTWNQKPNSSGSTAFGSKPAESSAEFTSGGRYTRQFWLHPNTLSHRCADRNT